MMVKTKFSSNVDLFGFGTDSFNFTSFSLKILRLPSLQVPELKLSYVFPARIPEYGIGSFLQDQYGRYNGITFLSPVHVRLSYNSVERLNIFKQNIEHFD